ncbi:hypothetical protein [uncultured Litoreibacter sp.]|uniref:hypothetical protein n=1 Tax=uncultured Litoreibacter sp. TaxID=1392394 RepID=UPI002623CDC3|nr:hypothetical protein [uncultured Litoreibacter sp.]
MSIKKLLGTGACMVIIGVSAGASYGLIQNLTSPAEDPVVAQVSPEVEAPTDTAAPAKFVAAAVTTWVPPEKSNVATPVLDKPASIEQPEPPLLRYTSISSSITDNIPTSTPLFAHIENDVVPETAAPLQETASTAAATAPSKPVTSAAPAPMALEIIVASAPRAIATPGTLRRFRSHTETSQDRGNGPTETGNSQFDTTVPREPVLKAAKPRRPSAARATRAVQRNARFRQTWATGVYR